MGEVWDCFHYNNGDRTRALYANLSAVGDVGLIAVNLLRVQKNSNGGKKKTYSGRGRRAAYSTKDWALGELCRVLGQHGAALGIEWGWGYDAAAVAFEHVLYVEVPGQGQVSFHTSYRGDGPDYGKPWDREKGVAHVRIITWAQSLLDGVLK